jgi:hypothetical protein
MSAGSSESGELSKAVALAGGTVFPLNKGVESSPSLVGMGSNPGGTGRDGNMRIELRSSGVDFSGGLYAPLFLFLPIQYLLARLQSLDNEILRE